MYAIIRTGGKQYTVRPGDVVQVEKLDQKLGSEFTIKDVLFVGGDTAFIGQPLVADAAVTAVVTKQAKSRKVIVFKKKRRHSFRKFGTHRQMFTELFIKAIKAPNGQTAKTDSEPRVTDMAQARQDRITQKMEDRKQRVSARGTDAEAAPARKTVKKVAKKVTKKAPAKKAAAKSAKKTAKKASK